jgi:hypothetical protein
MNLYNKEISTASGGEIIDWQVLSAGFCRRLFHFLCTVACSLSSYTGGDKYCICIIANAGILQQNFWVWDRNEVVTTLRTCTGNVLAEEVKEIVKRDTHRRPPPPPAN